MLFYDVQFPPDIHGHSDAHIERIYNYSLRKNVRSLMVVFFMNIDLSGLHGVSNKMGLDIYVPCPYTAERPRR